MKRERINKLFKLQGFAKDFTVTPPQPSPSMGGRMRAGFTLAEVLITLGIIGVVAAMTIPNLMAKYTKNSQYIQFMKARSVLENALKLYSNEYEYNVQDGSCEFKTGEDIKNFSHFFNGVQLVTPDNRDEICAGYEDKPVKTIKSEIVSDGGLDFCNEDRILDGIAGFTTIDGSLYLLTRDDGYGNGLVLDVNGPNSGPNVFARDIFTFYLTEGLIKMSCGSIWGVSKGCANQLGLWEADCYNTNTRGDADCGARLIEEGKMLY